MTLQDGDQFDVIVVGAGNAGLCAALSADEHGANTLLLEAASRDERGGNSRFSGGMFRFVHNGFEHVRALVTEHEWSDRVSFQAYSRERYFEDVMALSHGLSNDELVHTLVNESYGTVEWLRDMGVRWRWNVGKTHDPDQLQDDANMVLRDGSPTIAHDYGVGLIQFLFDAVESRRITVWYGAPAFGLLQSGSTVNGVRVRLRDRFVDVYGSVVLASGGFEANPELRLRYLGEGWDLVKVRGSRFNSGAVLLRAMDAGAQPGGHWGGAHAVPIDAGAPAVGSLATTDRSARYSYPFGITVNAKGERFVDEGEDEFRKTYAKMGAAIRAQPGGAAFQLFDQKTLHLLEPRYETATPVGADSIHDLALQLGVPTLALQRTIDDFNHSTRSSDSFDPFLNDGLCTEDVWPPKSNWALTLDRPPYVAYKVNCGITFTYGGLRIDSFARVIDNEGEPMPGLFATGEIVGEVFYHNYPAGAGLMLGSVYGRIAGRMASSGFRSVD